MADTTTTARRATRPTIRLVAGAAVFLALLAGTYVALVLTAAGQQVENLGLLGATLRAEPTRADSLASLGLVSVVSFALAIIVAAGIALARRRLALAIAAAMAMAGAVLIAEVLKEVLPRPEHLEGPAWLLRNSFPSGHATVAAAVGVGALVVAPGRLRWALLPVAALIAVVVGQATQITGWHRASDVLGGVLLVLAVTSMVLAVLSARGLAQPDDRGRVHPRIHRALLIVGAASLGVAGLLAILPVMLPMLRAPDGAAGAFAHLALGFAATGGVLLAFEAFGRLIEPLSFGRAAPTEDGPRIGAEGGLEPGR